MPQTRTVAKVGLIVTLNFRTALRHFSVFDSRRRYYSTRGSRRERETGSLTRSFRNFEHVAYMLGDNATFT